MACYHPVKVGVLRKPGVTGLRTLDGVTVGCGHCLGCRSDQARSWAIRLVHEGDVNPPAWFCTFTYAPGEVPDHGSLDPKGPTLFLKRLRRAHPEDRISYYLCGEYGERTERPHYHAVLYGAGFLDRDLLTRRSGAPVYTSDSLELAWSGGLCELTGLTYGAARYVAGYVRKKVRQRDRPDHYTRVDPATGELVELEREYGRMSRRPAIGRRWIERYWRDVYPRDYVAMGGLELRPPRYYDKWMDANHPEVMLEVREKRMEELRELSAYDLQAMEKAHRARVGLFQRREAV